MKTYFLKAGIVVPEINYIHLEGALREVWYSIWRYFSREAMELEG
ncbi:hypothetical protein SDC9_154658 [bioreactor metagenome]|uniref:Uncharacterized protein n=1 Tax=bioreactor metagenome TaxID=1076179 RepID=A0A645EZA3_9ZZZZ